MLSAPESEPEIQLIEDLKMNRIILPVLAFGTMFMSTGCSSQALRPWTQWGGPQRNFTAHYLLLSNAVS